MKRTGNLYSRIWDLENLWLAFWKAQRGKQAKKDVVQFRADFSREMASLQAALKTGVVAVGNYHYFTIHDPKERRICAASFRERVLHHAIMNVCETAFEKFSIYDSYACRKGKGCHRAVSRAQAFSRRNVYCLKLDIEKYFDRIDHRRLKSLLERLFKDRNVLTLFNRIIDSYETTPGRGLPIGNLTSQYFANHYLGPLDHFIKEDLRIKGYVRYMDDMLLWGDGRATLKAVLRQIRANLKDNLELGLKQSAVQLKPVASGVNFLGFRVFPDRILLGRRARRRYSRNMARCREFYDNGLWDEGRAARHAEALTNFTRTADAVGFRRKVIAGSGSRPEGLQPRGSRGQLEQRRRQLPGRQPQQQRPGQPQRQQRVPGRACPSSTGFRREPAADQGGILSPGEFLLRGENSRADQGW